MVVEQATENDKQLHHGSVHEEFKEIKEVQGIIQSIAHIYKDTIAVEMAVEKFILEMEFVSEQQIMENLNKSLKLNDSEVKAWKGLVMGDVDQNLLIEMGNLLNLRVARAQEMAALESKIQSEANNDLQRIIDEYKVIMDQYQEQPHLMDPHLEGMMTELLQIARDPKSPEPVFHLAFKLLYLITKTRGYKVIVRLLPHEVADVEPVLAMLAKQDPQDFTTWETRYMLLLWLSMVCMIPFDMVKLDSNARTESGEVRKPVMDRIIETGTRFLSTSDKSRDAASYMLSRFMTRPDVKKQKLPEFLDRTLTQLKSVDLLSMPGMITAFGLLNTLALIYKTGKREDLMPYGPVILKILSDLNLEESTNSLLRKLYTKLTQRIGLVFLKAKVAAWRYQRGSRSLSDNLKDSKSQQQTEWQRAQQEEDEYDIPDEIEDVIEMMLNSLRDKDTIVRWSAAKGIGRLTGRLPQELADEVVGSIMELFSISETDGAWHGGCLALAELGRRGLLLPARLPDVVPVIIKALRYDEKRGNISVGAHVRDAACYVVWAFARAYDPQELATYVNEIATALVLEFIFDRQVNVRRAAAAAFQEHVGRQGQFPHGIDILTTCDYFAVGNRINCYLELSVFVAQYAEYAQSMVDHLIEIKIGHWDGAIRELASQALNRLTPNLPEYMTTHVLPKLLKNSESIDVNLRHGSILAFAEIIQALSVIQKKNNKSMESILTPEIIESVKQIAPRLEKGQLFKGYGGELMRKSVCSLIEKSSLAQMPFHGDYVIKQWQELIDECLQHVELDVQSAAIDAIPPFFSEYYVKDGKVDPKMQGDIVEKYCKKLNDHLETTRMGFALAIGAFPKRFLCGKLRVVLDVLIQMSALGDQTNKMTEARRDAIKAIDRICQTVGAKKGGNGNEVICEENLDSIYKAYFDAMKDYTLDSRGDVGAWVREAAMTGLQNLSSMLVKNEPSLFQPEISRVMFCSLVQQCVEKIDRTRAHAGEVFADLLYHEPEIPNIPCRDHLRELFPKKDLVPTGINWSVPASTFPLFIKLLGEPVYQYSVLLGLVVSVGGLTESLVKHSAHALLGYLRSIKTDKDQMTAFYRTLIQVFMDYQKVDRVTLPMLKTLDQLLSNNLFDIVTQGPTNKFMFDLYEVCKAEVNKCGDVQRLLASIDVFCGILEFEGETRKKILSTLSVFMCHKFPIVRKNAAGKLFEVLIIVDDIVPEENLDEINALLSETEWDGSVGDVKPIRNRLCELLDIPLPVVAKKSGATK